ncbi:Wadjet anti-phage system protein JetA family protein [Ketobacter alkanivorans]|uniref:Flagellar protein FliT n=1 Tax=Ketobacter alkanivorans TaxID=1917421 RepID=A0A2K9LGK8_9GAMM|nr:Wadjet anti-phage system protein JetA family protein [Ketobacter alkanivorans]AUM11357.1 flagellar protein FliT [Ketobacter alkanivorans]
MFFSEERNQFFRPLTSKYREQILECLRLLYERLYSARADYGESLQRDQIIEIFEEALARAPQLDSGDYGNETRFKSEREQASWILNQLLEYGWIEKQVDQATLQSTFPFTRIGRMFTQSLAEMGTASVRTRHRNTRNTLNALEAFLSRGEVHDLMDAYEYSERIISDFSDVIAELEERKRELVRQVETQLLVQQATDHFFDFMEKRFQPDVSIRLSADSVEKHRDAIQTVIDKIRRKRKEFKREAELKLRELAPELVHPNQSVLYFVLDAIEIRMRNAADLMLPALRRALQSFTKRADIIIRQLSYLTSQRDNSVVDVCRELAQLDSDRQNQVLERAGTQLAGLHFRWLDPDQLRLQMKREERVLYTRIDDAGEVDESALREVDTQQKLDQAFITHNEGLHDYLITAMIGTNKVSTRDLPLRTARDVLAMSHAIETASYQAVDSDYQFVVSPTGETASNEFFDSFDVFDIELIKKPQQETDS